MRHDHRPLRAAGDSLPRLKVLIAEDNPVNALLVRTVFEKAGQDVTMASDGREAVNACRELARQGGGFDLVVMDLHMPVLDGLSAIAAIRKLEQRYGLARTRILTLTADERTQASEETLQGRRRRFHYQAGFAACPDGYSPPPGAHRARCQNTVLKFCHIPSLL